MESPRIGRIARALRHRLSLRQRDVADKAGTSRPMVSLLERGRIDEVSLPVLRRMMRVLEATSSWSFGGVAAISTASWTSAMPAWERQ